MTADSLKASVHLSEDEKLSDDYLIAEIDSTILACLNQDKDDYQKAYELMNGVRDAKKFSYLWDAYGIEFPAEMRHVPVLRGIFEALDGMNQARPFKYRITTSDQGSTDSMIEEMTQSILKDIERLLVAELERAQKEAAGQPSAETTTLEQKIRKIQEKSKNGFQASIEVSASHMLEWLMLKMQMKSKANTMFTDLRTVGQEYYQVKVVAVGQQPLFRVLNPLETYYVKGPNVKYIKDADRAMIRERLPVTEVWSLYGHKMTKEDQERFLNLHGDYITSANLRIVEYTNGTLEKSSSRGGVSGEDELTIPFCDVHYVEWKANTRIEVPEIIDFMAKGDRNDKIQKQKKKFKYRLDRFEGVRIGGDIHVDMGMSQFVPRDADNPSYCPLSINGACYGDRNGKPYSLALQTEDIADKIDILHYHAENLLAISGTKAVAMNFADIPAWMGADPMQRAMKWLGMVKQGIAIVDLTQVGEGVGKFNQMSDIDLSMSAGIQSIFVMIEYLEATAHKITGVPRQALGQITQNDGKGTSQIAVQGGLVVTQSLFTTHDEVMEQMLTDVLNASRVCYKDGVQGSYLLGSDGRKIFSIKAGQFNLANFNVFVNGDGTVERDREEVKNIAQELIKIGAADASMAVDMVTFRSLTDLKNKVKEAITSKQEDTTGQLQQQLQDVTMKLQAAEKNLQALSAGESGMKEKELALKEKEIGLKYGIQGRSVDNDASTDQTKLALDAKRVDLEALQISYSTGNAKEVRDK